MSKSSSAVLCSILNKQVHSGDSACSLPPYALGDDVQAIMRQQSVDMALELGVIGLMNVQFAVKNNEVYV